MATKLSPEEREAFLRCERQFAESMQQSREALTAIRDCNLYREDYATFTDYCRERWGIDQAAVDLIVQEDWKRRHEEAAAHELKFHQEHEYCDGPMLCKAGLPLPDRVWVFERLSKHPKDLRADIWRRVLNRQSTEPITADDIENAAMQAWKERSRTKTEGARDSERRASQSATVGTHRTSDRIITVHLNGDDLEWAKKCAAERDISVSGYIRDLVWLDRQQAKKRGAA